MTAELWVSILIALLSSSTVGALITSVFKAFLDKRMREDPQRVAMRLLLQDKLTDLCGKALADKSGMISLSSYTLIHRMYESYHELGGNGDMTHLMEAVDKLKVFVDNPNK